MFDMSWFSLTAGEIVSGQYVSGFGIKTAYSVVRQDALGSTYLASLRLRISVTCCGLALPLVAFMICPTSELKAFSLPVR